MTLFVANGKLLSRMEITNGKRVSFFIKELFEMVETIEAFGIFRRTTECKTFFALNDITFTKGLKARAEVPNKSFYECFDK